MSDNNMQKAGGVMELTRQEKKEQKRREKEEKKRLAQKREIKKKEDAKKKARKEKMERTGRTVPESRKPASGKVYRGSGVKKRNSRKQG